MIGDTVQDLDIFVTNAFAVLACLSKKERGIV